MERIEHALSILAEAGKIGAESIGVLVVCVGLVVALVRGFLVLGRSRLAGFREIRFTLSRFLILGLEFQLAADVLGTAVAPDWYSLGRLGVVAFIRTFLNYFLAKELKDEEQEAQAISPDYS